MAPTMIDITKMLNSPRTIIFDGALGTLLQDYGLRLGENPTLMNLKSPKEILQIHAEYIAAGSDIICANTFIASALALQGTGYKPQPVITAAVEIASRAADGTHVAVALDIGSLGELLEPSGDLSFDSAYAMFKEMAQAGEKAGADLVAIETMSDSEELVAAMSAVSENTCLPIFATMTFEKTGFTYMGCTPEKFAAVAEDCGAVAMGINCSLAPFEMYDIVKRIKEATRLPLIVKPNAGLPDPMSGAYNVSPEQFAEQMLPYLDVGVKVVGGCCGTTPAHIAALKRCILQYQ